ncbi:MAG: hypothetical protein AAFY60_15100, partial [Myxococcota bacterium]
PMRSRSLLGRIASGVGLIATGFLLALTGSWLALPLGVAVTSLVVTLASNVVGLSPKVLLKAESTTTWQFVREGVPYVAAGVAAYVSNLGLDLVLAFQGLSQEVAPYRLTAALSFASIYVLPASLARASVAADAAYRGESPAAQSQALLFSTSIAALATVSALVVLAPIAGLLYGSTWRAPVGALMGPMCILVGIRALAAPFGGLLIARGAHRSENVFRLTESLIGTLIFGLMAEHGLPWAILGSSVSYLLGIVARAVLFIVSGEKLGIGADSRYPLIAGIAWPFVFALIAYSAVPYVWVPCAIGALGLTVYSALKLRRS